MPNSQRALAASFMVALVLRLLFVFVGFPYLQPRMNLREDGDGYWRIAQTIRDGTYDDVTRSPLYPAFLAAVNSRTGVRVVQAVLDSMVCLFVAWLAGVLTQGRVSVNSQASQSSVLQADHPPPGGVNSANPTGAGIWAAWLWAVYPFAIWRTAFFNKEALLPLLLAGAVGVQVIAIRRDRWSGWFAAGLALAAATYGKTIFLLWPVVLLGVLTWNRQLSRRVIGLMAGLVLAILPWTIRNYYVTGGAILPVATEYGGKSTFVGNYRPSDGEWEGPQRHRWEAALEEIDRAHPGASHLELNRARYHAVWEHVRADPLAAARLVVRKMGRFWFFSQAHRVPWTSVSIQVLYLALGVIGWWGLRRGGWLPQLLVGLVAYTMVVYALTLANLRYSVDVMPFVCALGGVGLAGLRGSSRTTE